MTLEREQVKMPPSMAAQDKESKPERLNYLDGLRGWAALIVVMGHTALTFTYDAPSQPELIKSIQNGYFRILLDGGLSVKIFFILSGIVLSRAFIESRDFSKLSAMVIKRIPRLAIPIFAMMLISHILMKAGLMYNVQAIEVLKMNTWLSWCYNFDSNIKQLISAIFSTFFGGGNAYSTALWTMPHEMMGSIFVAIILLCVSFVDSKKAKPFLLFIFFGLLVFKYKQAVYANTLICFLFGIICAYYIQNKIKANLLTKIILLLITLFLYFYQLPIGNDLKSDVVAALVILLLINSSILRKLFSAKISVFLGKVSFPLYVIHMPIICSFTSYLITIKYYTNDTKLILMYFGSTVLLSIVCACILYPVEKFAVTFSGKIFEYLSTEKRITDMLKLKRI